MIDETKDKHTPGPWFRSGCDGCGDLWIETDKTPIASARSQGPTEELRAETKANAKLIAASPDLLAALVLCVEDYEDGLQDTDAWQMLHIGKVERPPTPIHIMAARAAIAKAREG